VESFYWFILTIALIPILVGSVAVLSYYLQSFWSDGKKRSHS